jgi:hypothetical protein
MFKIDLYIFMKIQANVTTCINLNSCTSTLNILFLSQWHAKYTNQLWVFS